MTYPQAALQLPCRSDPKRVGATVAQPIRASSPGTDEPQAPGIGYGGGEFICSHPRHWGAYHRVRNLKQLAYSRMQHSNSFLTERAGSLEESI
jgi:hypothetical protein